MSTQDQLSKDMSKDLNNLFSNGDLQAAERLAKELYFFLWFVPALFLLWWVLNQYLESHIGLTIPTATTSVASLRLVRHYCSLNANQRAAFRKVSEWLWS